MNEAWKSDPRLAAMSKEKLRLLSEFADELAKAPQEQKPAVLLSLHARAAASRLSFTGRETDLLISILTEHLPPEEQAKFRLLSSFTGRPQARK